MSGYCFDVHHGANFIVDEEGIAFDSLAAAECAAVLTAAALELDQVRKGDAAGRKVVVEVRASRTGAPPWRRLGAG